MKGVCRHGRGTPEEKRLIKEVSTDAEAWRLGGTCDAVALAIDLHCCRVSWPCQAISLNFHGLIPSRQQQSENDVEKLPSAPFSGRWAEPLSAGFRQTHAGNAGAEALAELVRARLAAQDGPLFWPHGEQTAFDITRPLAAAGFATQEAIIYRMQRAAKLPDQLDRLLQSGRPAALLVASAGQLGGFAELLKEAGLWHCAKGLVLLAGSQRIAAAVPSSWQDIRLADNKSHAGLLALARDWAERQDPAEPQD
ncbi:MAG: hypothetical protein EBZ13_07940 [Planctomycetia bacterium]|nr:hypothetical protein [Planctomycetia bacterium]